MIIPATAGKAKKGGDHRNYFYRVKDVISFLNLKWGPPEAVAYPPAGGGTLSGKKGLSSSKFMAGVMLAVMQRYSTERLVMTTAISTSQA